MGVKNYKQEYDKWVMDKAKNEVIANTDTTPSVGGVFEKYVTNLTPGIGATTGAPQGALRSTPKVVSPGNVDASGAPIGSPSTPYTETEDFAKWVAEKGFTYENGKINTNPTQTTPTETTPTVTPTPDQTTTDTNQSEQTNTAPPTVSTETESGFAKWIESDPTIQARMRQAESDYYRNRAGYGVQGENLAQSGLIGSGWDSHMDATAYAAMQAEKAGVRSGGYAKWLGDQETAKAESAANADRLNADAQTVFSYLVEQGKESITDADLSYFYGLGFSKDAIDKAVTAYNDYSAKNKAEVSETIKTDLNKVTESGDAKGFLESVGVDTSVMDDETLAATMGSYVEKAFAEGSITAEDRSKHYASDIMKDIEEISPTDSKKSVASTAAGVIDAATAIKDKLTEADYKALVDSAFDAINVVGIGLGKEGHPAGDVTIRVRDNNGDVTEITADWDSNPSNSVEKELTKQFGSASLAVYKDKIYYQYKSGGWREIDVKVGWGSEGTTAYGRDILKVVAQYVSDNKLDYRKNHEKLVEKGPRPKDADSVDAQQRRTISAIGAGVSERDWEQYKNGRISREEFIKRVTDDFDVYPYGFANKEAAVLAYMGYLDSKK